MPDAASAKENGAPPAGPGDDNNEAKGGSSTKTKSTRRREQTQRRKARETATAATSAAIVPAVSSFIGDDPELPALDWTTNIAIFYCKFKREMARHAGFLVRSQTQTDP